MVIFKMCDLILYYFVYLGHLTTLCQLGVIIAYGKKINRCKLVRPN